MPATTPDSMGALAGQSRRATSWLRQLPQRQAERRSRGQVVRLCDELAACGHPRSTVARQLQVSYRTLGRWRQAARRERPDRPRGRPCKQSPASTRQAVLDWLQREGCHLGLPALRAAFPDVPRCELLELQQAWRRADRAQRRMVVAKLHWHQPGCVWAMDHTAPPEPVDGELPAILCVRDLATGMQLAWEPVPDQTAETTIRRVESLFLTHGPPLVVKSDNGSAFRNAFGALLTRYGVTPLPSPPRKPQYNGSCEATQGHSKIRTAHFAQRDHAGHWTTAALQAAQRQANEVLRPQGHRRPTASARWADRPPITPAERADFLHAVATERQALSQVTSSRRRGILQHERFLSRAAVRRVLLDRGLLSLTPRSITPPFKLQK